MFPFAFAIGFLIMSRLGRERRVPEAPFTPFRFHRGRLTESEKDKLRTLAADLAARGHQNIRIPR